jgi:rhodanese-related sulfurtransferase
MKGDTNMRGVRQVLIGLVLGLTIGAAAAGIAAVENQAAWEAAAGFMTALPDGFNGVKADALKAKLDSGEPVFLLDVREAKEFAGGRIEGAVNVPVRDVAKSLDRLPADRNAPIVVLCASAVRSGYATMALSFKGYSNVKHLAAGYSSWEKAGYPLEK